METNKQLTEIQDKLALKELVDTFSILADQKDAGKQAALFTEDARVNTYLNDQLITSLKGRQQIKDVFQNFLNSMEIVYHLNGQQTVSIDGNRATGTSYCFVTLIGMENGKRVKTTNGVYYSDEYVKVNGRWLIANRKSTFAWQEKVDFR